MKMDRAAKWIPGPPEKWYRLKIFTLAEGRVHDLPNNLSFEAAPPNVCLQWVMRPHRPFLCLESGSEYQVRQGFYFWMDRTDTWTQLRQRVSKYRVSHVKCSTGEFHD
jgi:hypothetical protein